MFFWSILIFRNEKKKQFFLTFKKIISKEIEIIWYPCTKCCNFIVEWKWQLLAEDNYMDIIIEHKFMCSQCFQLYNRHNMSSSWWLVIRTLVMMFYFCIIIYEARWSILKLLVAKDMEYEDSSTCSSTWEDSYQIKRFTAFHLLVWTNNFQICQAWNLGWASNKSLFCFYFWVERGGRSKRIVAVGVLWLAGLAVGSCPLLTLQPVLRK